MGRAPCCDKANVKKGPWSPEEDAKLKSYIEQHGTGGNWIALPQKIGLKRCGKSCRLRWLNYLRPNIKHGGFTEEEDRIICSLYVSIGSRWSIIAAQLPGRTDNDIKNYWNTRLKKKLFGKQRKETEGGRSRSLKQEINKRERGCGNPMLQDDDISGNKATFWPELHVFAPMPQSNQDPNLNHHFTSPSNLHSKTGERFSVSEEPMSTNVQHLAHNIFSSTQYVSSHHYEDGKDFPVLKGQSSFAAEIEEALYSEAQRLEGLENLYDSGMVNSSRIGTASGWMEFSSLVNPFTSNCGNTEQGLLQECQFNELRYLGVQ